MLGAQFQKSFFWLHIDHHLTGIVPRWKQKAKQLSVALTSPNFTIGHSSFDKETDREVARLWSQAKSCRLPQPEPAPQTHRQFLQSDESIRCLPGSRLISWDGRITASPMPPGKSSLSFAVRDGLGIWRFRRLSLLVLPLLFCP